MVYGNKKDFFIKILYYIMLLLIAGIGFVISYQPTQEEPPYWTTGSYVIPFSPVTTGEIKIQTGGTSIQQTSWGIQSITRKDSKPTSSNAGNVRQDKPTKVLDQVRVQFTGQIIHKGFSTWDCKQEMVNYAYRIGNDNLKILVECENWNWDYKAIWDEWNAVWLCQAWVNNSEWMKDHTWINVSKYKTDWKYQLDVCWRLRQEWTPFYWPERKIYKNKKFVWLCYQYVRDRFIIKYE